MHRQQRFRTTTSSFSSFLLPLSTCRSSSTLTASTTPNFSSILKSKPTTTTATTTTTTTTTLAETLSPSAIWSPSPSESSSYRWRARHTSCCKLTSKPWSASIPFCPRLISVFAWSMTLLLLSSCIGLTDAGILNGHPLGKRSFIDIQCKGIYDKSIFARLDRICEDCYNLFREPQLHQLCRKNCFTSDYFKGCLDVLLLQDEVEKIQTWIKQLHGAEPGV